MELDFPHKVSHEKDKLKRTRDLYRRLFGEELTLDAMSKAVEVKIEELKAAVIKEALSHYRSTNTEDVDKLLILKQVIRDEMAEANPPPKLERIAEPVGEAPKIKKEAEIKKEADAPKRQQTSGYAKRQ